MKDTIQPIVIGKATLWMFLILLSNILIILFDQDYTNSNKTTILNALLNIKNYQTVAFLLFLGGIVDILLNKNAGCSNKNYYHSNIVLLCVLIFTLSYAFTSILLPGLSASLSLFEVPKWFLLLFGLIFLSLFVLKYYSLIDVLQTKKVYSSSMEKI